MKSKHLAKADFLRQLGKHTKALYELGDFTSDDPNRAKLSAKLEGFIEAGKLIEVATRDEIQAVIDKAHLAAFGEAREARRARILEERAQQAKDASTSSDTKADGAEAEVDWEIYDSPAVDRRSPRT